MELSASIFKAYDIRGIVPSALNPEFAKDLGRGLAARAKAAGVTTMVVGRDGRISSPTIRVLGVARVGTFPGWARSHALELFAPAILGLGFLPPLFGGGDALRQLVLLALGQLIDLVTP